MEIQNFTRLISILEDYETNPEVIREIIWFLRRQNINPEIQASLNYWLKSIRKFQMAVTRDDFKRLVLKYYIRETKHFNSPYFIVQKVIKAVVNQTVKYLFQSTHQNSRREGFSSRQDERDYGLFLLREIEIELLSRQF